MMVAEEQSLDAHLTAWSDPVARLRQAIEKNEFALYCQPILFLGSGGGYPMAEVLVRLREEEKAFLPPGEFIPVLEHYRMMAQLDRWVVHNTVKRLAAGSRIPRLTVNVSKESLASAELPRFAAGQLAQSRIATELLLFEIDETDLLSDPDAVARFAAAARDVGGGVLIDGFGRRSVSFDAIKAVGVTFLKVDGGITRKLMKSEAARNKMNAILSASRALRFAVVAECVEEHEVLVRLKALGVSYAQGFGIYQPHAIDDIVG